MPRLFLAIWPPAEVVAALALLPRPDEPGVRWVAPDKWHLTLRFLGAAEVGDVASALAAARLPSAHARMGPAVRRLGGRAIVVPVAGLDELATAVVGATAQAGQPPDPRGFAGHLTLGRLGKRRSTALIGERFEADFIVDDVTLVASVLSPDGATYEIVDRWLIG